MKIEEALKKEHIRILYSGFIEWCKQWGEVHSFSTYCDGEPFCCAGVSEIAYSIYQKECKKELSQGRLF